MRRRPFNDGWYFGEIESDLRPVKLPHDAMIHRKRDRNAPTGSGQAFFPGGSYIYRKNITLSEEDLSLQYILQFEGVYRNAKVYINGKYAGGCAYGYSQFYVNCKGIFREGDNLIQVDCDNVAQPESRWYSGAGIYRPVWMWEGKDEFIKPDGIKVQTETYAPAKLRIDIDHTGNENCELELEILYKDKVVWTHITDKKKVFAEIPNARLWDEENPELYVCRAKLKKNGRSVDDAETAFGIRKIEWSSNGVFINGKSILLRGGCVHHDHGILGAATYDESEYRRVKRLKSTGYNAIRSSHNPASRAMLDACDRLGMYVIDESWDMWFHHKNKYDYASDWRENFKYDLEQMVVKDFNHPSVLFYSIGNEVSEPAKQEGLEVIKEMKDYLHKLDHGRPVTGGFNLMIIKSSSKGKGVYNEDGGMNVNTEKGSGSMSSTMFNLMTSMVGTGMNKSANSKKADRIVSPALDLLDIAGYNYSSGRYPLEGKAHPNRVIYGSETFPQDIVKNWRMVVKYPYLIGDFMWSSWDYLGEVGVGSWAYTDDGKGFNKPYPWLLADCGAFDILGNPGMPAALASAAWKRDKNPVIGVLPLNHPGIKPAKAVWRGSNGISSWSWSGCEGYKAVVEIYSSAAMAELIQDEKSLGKKTLKDCKAIFKTRYKQGELVAITYDENGNKIGESKLSSAAGNVGPHIIPEEKTVRPGQVCYVDIVISDEKGIVESAMDEKLKIEVKGGELLAFGSANPRTEECFDDGEYSTYYGRALAVVRAGEEGMIEIIVTGEKETVTEKIFIGGERNE